MVSLQRFFPAKIAHAAVDFGYTCGKLRFCSAIALIVILSLPIAALPPRQEATPLSSQEQIQEEFAHVPCKSKERLSAVQTLFKKMGASPEEVSIEKVKDAQNLVVTRKGTEPGKI